MRKLSWLMLHPPEAPSHQKDSGKCLLRRQLQLRSQRRILTAFHPVRYNGIPFGQPQNPQYPIFKLCLPAIFIVLPCTEKSNSVFAISGKGPCSGIAGCGRWEALSASSLAVRGIPAAAEWNRLLKENRLPLPFYSPAAVFQNKRRPRGLRLWILFQISGTGSGNFSEVTTVTISQRALSSSGA